ncbi:MAG: hypothetical protein H0W30_12895 [Gemmatimonadaceae bacterium]|nr:hypothetical protein [Gemmatimonadaceae bacterium]
MLLVSTGCGGEGADKKAAVETQEATTSAPASVASGPVPDACTFYSKSELESAVGWQLDDGDVEDAEPGAFKCDFETPPQMSVTTTFPNPPLPQSVRFSSMTVNTHPVKQKSFDDFRKMIGAGGEDVPGIGDGAYFYGPNMIYVRVGARGFSLRMYADPTSDSDKAKAREVMLSLARLGATKLR